MTQEHALHPAREHSWITTFSGERIKSTAVRSGQISFDDMVRGLAMQVRYLGQIREFYSIAEHSILVSRIAEADGADSETIRAALFHDGHEYITGDFPSPYKHDVEGLRSWEAAIEMEFRRAFSLPPNHDPIWERVKRYDLIALHLEAINLMQQDPGWIDSDLVAKAPKELRIVGMDWRQASQAFYDRVRQINQWV